MVCMHFRALLCVNYLLRIDTNVSNCAQFPAVSDVNLKLHTEARKNLAQRTFKTTQIVHLSDDNLKGRFSSGLEEALAKDDLTIQLGCKQ